MWKLQNIYVKIFALFIIVLCVYPLYTLAKVSTFTHTELKDYGTNVQPRVWKIRAYEDGTLVLRIVRSNNTIEDVKFCAYEMFSLRIIHPNGTVHEKDIDLGIQPFNYCVISNQSNIIEFLSFHPIRSGQILIIYHNATDIDDIYTYEEWGMIIDLDGNILNRTFFGFAFVLENKQLMPNSAIIFNNNPEKQYRVEKNGEFVKLTDGKFEFIQFTLLLAAVVNTPNDGYAVIYLNTTGAEFKKPGSLLPQAQLFATIIGYNQRDQTTFLLYQTQLQNLTFSSISCDILSVGVGQSCILTVRQKDSFGEHVFNFKINFLSSGAVVSFTIMNRKFPIENRDWVIDNLPFGGYLITYTYGVDGTFMYGYLSGENDTNYTRWELDEPERSNDQGAYIILPYNNTLLMAQMEYNNTWTLKMMDLPKFTERDNGYSNINIQDTFPKIHSLVGSNILNISITFYDPVELSDGRISIYQVDGPRKNLRQTTSGIQSILDNDDKRVTVKILDSTFSKSDANYSIKMDNNFVKSRAYKEPLLGIVDGVWTFKIEDKEKYTIVCSTSGLLRLSIEGTKNFENGNYSHDQFFNTLLAELANSVLVPHERLSTNKITQIDTSSKEKQLLISIVIKGTKGKYEKSVDSIIKDINNMIEFKDQTPIGQGQITQYLDNTFGFKPAPDYWEEYKFKLLDVSLVIVILIILYIFAYIREKKGNNIAIFQFVLFIFDFVMDILFVNNNAKDVPVLYIPRLNTILAFLIITKENTSPKFLQWFTDNIKIASIFTILAGADIEVLNILQSNLAGFKFFQAPFSDSAKSKIFWGACLNIFTEDVPQLIIQILYRHNTVTYDIVPILALISSVLNLVINIMGRLYQAINYVLHSLYASTDNRGSHSASISENNDSNSNSMKEVQSELSNTSTVRLDDDLESNLNHELKKMNE